MTRSRRPGKNVVSCKMSAVASKGFAYTVYIMAIRLREIEPGVNQIVMNDLLDTLREINGGEFNSAQLVAEKADIKRMVCSVMSALIGAVEAELPHLLGRLQTIDWRALFGVTQQPIIRIHVTIPSDDESGISTSHSSYSTTSKSTDSLS